MTVCVEDCGGGVTEEELPHLKEKFKRGGSVEGIEGAGLGLYISDHCMREMGGQLVLKNGTESGGMDRPESWSLRWRRCGGTSAGWRRGRRSAPRSGESAPGSARLRGAFRAHHI